MLEKVSIPEGERGLWSVKKFTVEPVDPYDLGRLRALRDGRGHVPPGTYTKLVCQGRGVIMSDTPDEMRDHVVAVRKATGDVLINGLGIGMVLAAVLRKPKVTSVTVVEIDPDVIALVSPYYADDRLQIVCASAFDYQPPKGKCYNMVWHDIWDAISEDNLAEMTRLKRKYGRLADWQGCWAEAWCRR